MAGALVACDFCRHRKRRCDGQKPCSTCRDSNADCVYKELPNDRIEDASPTAVVDRLARIEALLEQQSQQLHHLGTPTSSTPTYMPVHIDYFSPASCQPSASDYADPGTGQGDWSHESPQFLIPRGHTTIASTLLSIPKIRELLGEGEYSRDYFYNVEENLPLPESLTTSSGHYTSWPTLRPESLKALAESYFHHVHHYNPLFGRQTFNTWQAKLISKAPLDDPETAICLCVYALGSLALHNGEDGADEEQLGFSFFKPALEIIIQLYTWVFKPSLEICQALLLAASYFLYLGRPLHCWRMSLFASQTFLHYMDFNRAAEMDVPRSGIEPLGDKMPLPHSLDSNDDEDTMNFVAEISVRRLLNRIHCSLYSPEKSGPAVPSEFSSPNPMTWQGLSLQKLLALSAELDRQLTQWYVSMPDTIRPPRGVEPVATDWGRILRIRYYAAKHIIHRPFILYTMMMQQQQQKSRTNQGLPGLSPVTSTIHLDAISAAPTTSAAATSSSSAAAYATSSTTGGDAMIIPQIVLDRCEGCIESSTTYIYNAVEMLDRRSPYLWSFAQSCMACVIVLTVAHHCEPLRGFVPDVPRLRDLVVDRLEKWAVQGSSFEAEVAILRSLVFDDSS